METFHFWSATLDKNNKEKQWASSDDEDVRILSFSNVFLGDTSKGEQNIVQIEYTDVDGEDVSCIFCVLQKGLSQFFIGFLYLYSINPLPNRSREFNRKMSFKIKFDNRLLFLGVTDSMQIQLKTSEDFKLVLKKGNGPIYIMATESTQIVNDMDDASLGEDEDLEEESELTSEASPVKMVKGAGSKKKFIDDEADEEEDDAEAKVASPPAKKKRTDIPASKVIIRTSNFS